MTAAAEPISEQQIRAILEAIPYARFLGVQADLRGDELTLVLPFKDELVGNPALPALHGGVVGAFLELTAVTQLSVARRQSRLPKTIDIGVDYLRSGRPTATYGRAKITKLGRRLAHARVEAWQNERSDPIALLHGHFQLPSDET